MINSSDWRRQGQERYLLGKSLVSASYLAYANDDIKRHDHCEFCGSKFSIMPDDLKEGFCTTDRYHWICTKCYQDFKLEFGWKLDTYI